MILKAKKEDLEEIAELAKLARENMLESGLKQWVDNYPNQAHFLADLKNDGLYVLKENNKIIASVSILPENEAAYKEIKWLKDNSLVIHRVIVNPDYQKKGIGKSLFNFASQLAEHNNYESIKVDTHPDNHKMQGLILKMGYKPMGYLKGINRLAYERLI